MLNHLLMQKKSPNNFNFLNFKILKLKEYIYSWLIFHKLYLQSVHGFGVFEVLNTHEPSKGYLQDYPCQEEKNYHIIAFVVKRKFFSSTFENPGIAKEDS